MPTDVEPSTKRRRKFQRRPRLNPIATYVPGVPNASQRTIRVPHDAIKRKYCKCLNAKLERLRRAVPTLLHSHEGKSIGQLNPSKSIVIAAAINHIEVIRKKSTMPCGRRMIRSESFKSRIVVRREDANEEEEVGSYLRVGSWFLTADFGIFHFKSMVGVCISSKGMAASLAYLITSHATATIRASLVPDSS